LNAHAIDRPVVVVLTSARRRGAEIQGFGVGRGLAERGHDVTVVALEPGGGSSALEVAIIGSSAKSLATFRALRRRLDGAVVIAHGSTTLPAVAFATVGTDVPWVYRSIGDPQAWVRHRLHRVRTGILMRRADAVVTLWAGASGSINRLYGVPADRLFVLPNHRSSVDFPSIEPGERDLARSSLGLDGPLVLYLGSISEEKRPGDAVRIISRLPGATLVMAGVGPDTEEIAHLAAKIAPGQVRMVGEIDDPARLLAAADVLLLPSRTEGMPGVVIEAQLRGVPVVASAVGAVADMVRDGIDGFLFSAGDIDAAVRSLGTVLADPARFAGTATQDARARYDLESVLSGWESVLGAVLAGRHSTR